MERGRVIKATGTDPRHDGTGVRFVLFLCGVVVDPGVDFAFFPSQVLADPVGGQFPVPPFLADGALGNGQYRGYFAGGEHPVGAAERSRAWPYSFPVGVRLLFVTVTGLCFHGGMYLLLSAARSLLVRAAGGDRPPDAGAAVCRSYGG